MHKAVLVTGASSGIGEAIVLHLAHKGFRVFAAARRLEALQTLAGVAGDRVDPVPMDVTDEASIAKGFAKIAETGATLYGLVNNAGLSVAGPIETTPLEDWRRQFETNVFGAANVVRAAAPQMRAAGAGRIINISSVAGRIAPPFLGVYASSKHAIEGLSDALRRELRPFGVEVAVIRPGFINTSFGEQEQEGLRRHIGAGAPYADAVNRFMKWHEKQHPNAPPPTIVAEAVHHTLTVDRPHTYYTAPFKMWSRIAMRNFLPARLSDKIMARVIGLPNGD